MRRRVVIAIAVGAVVVVSCGAGPLEDAGTERGDDLVESVPAVAPADPTAPPEEIGCPNFLAQGEDRATRRSYEASKLGGDVRRLSDYGASRPDTFGGLRFVHNPTRLEIGFKADIDEHCYILRELAKRPNAIDVIRVEYSIADKLAAAEVAARAGASTRPPGLGPLHVHLPAFAEGIAADLHAAYGDMFAIEVGAWPYPPPRDVPVEEVCPPVVESEELPPLRVTMTSPSGPLNYLKRSEVGMVVENGGSVTGRLFWGQQVSWLFAGDDDSQPVARYTGMIEAWGAGGELKPGDTVEMTAFIGLSPCSLDDGYMLPPGTYQLRVPLEFKWNDEPYVMLLDPVPVVVEETPPTSLPPKQVTTNTAPPTTLGS